MSQSRFVSASRLVFLGKALDSLPDQDKAVTE